MWFIGLGEATEGVGALQVLADPWFSVGEPSPAVDALLAAMRENYAVLLPLNIARLLVGALMVGVCVAALVSWRLSIGLALQTLAAAGSLTVLAYILERPLRAPRLDALLAQDSALVNHPPPLDPRDIESAGWLVALGGQLLALALCAIALTRPRTREFLAARAARREEH